MTLNGKTADEVRAEFFAALDRDREENKQALAASRLAFDQKLEAQRLEFDREMKAQRREWGNYTRADGLALEEEGVVALKRLGTLGGMAVTDVRGAFKLNGREYDGVAYFPAAGAVAPVEFKRRLRRGDVKRFARVQLRWFPTDCAHLLNGCALYGVVAGRVVDKEAEEEARARGLFVVRLPTRRAAEVLNAEARPQANGKAAE